MSQYDDRGDSPLITGKGSRILIIDDEAEIQRAVRSRLAAEGFTVESATLGRAGIDAVSRWHPDVIILDLALPDMDGVAVCRELREWTPTPIIVLSVRDRDADKLAALDSGADDYLTKPFSMVELLARIRVALRHAAQVAGGAPLAATIQIGGLAIDLLRRQVVVEGKEARLTPTEYAVLVFLARNAGRVITHRVLLRAVWGPNYERESHYLHVFIGQLRRKIEPEYTRPRYLLTDPGVGYRLSQPSDTSDS